MLYITFPKKLVVTGGVTDEGKGPKGGGYGYKKANTRQYWGSLW